MREVRWVYLLLLLFIGAALYYLNTRVVRTQHVIASNIKNLFIEEAGIFSRNIRQHLLETVDPKRPIEKLRNDPDGRRRLERALSLLLTPTYPYIYIVYRDEDGRYRYLVDGSVSEEKGSFGEWIHVDAKRWDEVYFRGEPRVLAQKKFDTLWGTYLYPIREGNRTAALVAIDFSTHLPAEIKAAAQPVNTIFFYILTAIGVLIVLLLWQSLLLFWARKKSYTDPLTGAFNRLYLRRFFQNRQLTGYRLLMLDLDHFKRINDEYGHKTGDAVLQEFARRIRENIRESDLFVRYGGEEFLLFLKEGVNESARQIAERIRKVIGETPFFVDHTTLHVTTSIGVVEKPSHYRTPTLALKAADELLYLAKRQGRNRVVSESDRETPGEPEQNLGIHAVRQALEEGRVVCHYQPIYDLASGRVVEYESLVRIVGPDGKIHYPGAFLPQIHQTTLYNDLTKRVLQLLFARVGREGCVFSVNLNLTDLLDNDVYRTILEALENNRAIADRIVIELLEHETTADTRELQSKIETIKSYGVRIALDDFGSGYANFALFQNLSIDILKIDGSLVRHITTSERSYKIVESIYEFARRMGLETVAEFIHDEKTLRAVREIGIPYGQGFHLRPPLPEEELANAGCGTRGPLREERGLAV